MGVIDIEGTSYHINDNLIRKWDALRNGKLKKVDEDRVYVTDGREGTGKSLFTIQQAFYMDQNVVEDMDKNGKILPSIPIGNAKSWEIDSPWRREAIKRFKNGTLLPNITFNAAKTLEAIRKSKSTLTNTTNIIFDEAFRGMSAKGVLSKENRTLVQVLMEMRQNNLVLWIVSPSFYLLELYPAMIRSNALFHVKKDKKSLKRVVRIFNFKKKAKLYQIGLRKGWGYPLFTKQTVNFYNKYPKGKDFEWRYRLKKQLSLKDSEKTEVIKESKWRMQRDNVVKGLYKEIKSLRKVSEKLKEWKVPLGKDQIAIIVKDTPKDKDSSPNSIEPLNSMEE